MSVGFAHCCDRKELWRQCRFIEREIRMLQRYIKDLNPSNNPQFAERTGARLIEVVRALRNVSSACNLVKFPAIQCMVARLENLIKSLPAANDEDKLNALYALACKVNSSLCEDGVEVLEHEFDIIRLKCRFTLLEEEGRKPEEEGRNPEDICPDKTEFIESVIGNCQ